MDVCFAICKGKFCQGSDKGVGMLIGPRVLKSLNSIEKIQLRMIVATLNGNPSTMIICYSPTNTSDKKDLVTFYNELFLLVHSILKHSIVIIGGDMNAQIGDNINNKFSLHNSSNRNGEHLTDFTQEDRLTYCCGSLTHITIMDSSHFY